MKRSILAGVLSLTASAAFAQSPTFVTIAKGPVGSPIPITVYLDGAPVAPGSVTWSGPATVSCAPTTTGFACTGTAIGLVSMKATHSIGTFANLTLNVTAGLQFSSP